MSTRPTQDELLTAYEAAPDAIQETLSEGRGIQFILAMQKRFNLHVDLVGTVSDLIWAILLGFISPQDFFGELKASGIDEIAAKQITEALNTEVFIPLRDEMHAQGVKPIAPPKLVPSIPPGIVPLRPVEPRPVASAPTPVAPAPAPVPTFISVASAPLPVPPLVVPIYVPPAPVVPEQPAVRTMAHDMEAIKHPNATPPTPWQPPTQARSFQTSSIPNTTAAIPHLPGSVPSTPVPSVTPSPISQTPTQPAWQPQPAPTQRPASTPIVKEYGVDPYRETPE